MSEEEAIIALDLHVPSSLPFPIRIGNKWTNDNHYIVSRQDQLEDRKVATILTRDVQLAEYILQGKDKNGLRLIGELRLVSPNDVFDLTFKLEMETDPCFIPNRLRDLLSLK